MRRILGVGLGLLIGAGLTAANVLAVPLPRHDHGLTEICGRLVSGDAPHHAHFSLSPRRTDTDIESVSDTGGWLIVSASCDRGSTVSLHPRGVVKISRKVPAQSGHGLAAIWIDPVHVGTALITVRRHHRLVGRLRIKVVRSARLNAADR